MKTGQVTIRKKLLQTLVYLLVFTLLFTMSACKNSDDTPSSTQDINADALSDHNAPSSFEALSDIDDILYNITEPTLVVRGVKTKPGVKNVEVVVEIKNNPGILGIDFDLYYDSSALTLIDAKSSLNLEGCHFTAPSYYRNPTSFLWDFQDANWFEDGTILKLYFDVSETASLGEHEIKIMYSYGDIFDSDGNPLNIKLKSSSILVEE